MIEEALEIHNYLPVSYKNPPELEYVKFLWDSFVVNYESGKYPFAFISYHMLFMTFVYFEIWQIKQNNKSDFEKAMIGFNKDIENKLNKIDSPFGLHCVNESALLRILKLLGFENSEIGNFSKNVQNRNSSAHSNGVIFFKSKIDLDLSINEVLRCVESIQRKTKNAIELLYGSFLSSSSNPEDREYMECKDQVREILVHKNYLSLEDIRIALDYGIDSFKTLHHF